MHSFPNRAFLLLVLAGLLILPGLRGQEPVVIERSSNKVILEGKVYYIHMVEPGQTLYSIARAYGISQKEIAIENPGVVSGLQMGQALKIPVEPSMQLSQEESPPSRPDKARTHKVKRGETFYGIARAYGLSESDLQKANPEVDPTGLRPGQRLLIPEQKPEPVDQNLESAYDEDGLVYYKVKRKDTLYSLAREFGVKVEDIRAANPELGWGGPQTGQVIRIPLPQVVDHPEMAMDSLERPGDSLALEVQEAYEYEELMNSHANPRKVYRVAFLIPFAFEEPEPLDTLLKDVNSISRRNRIIERYRMEAKEPQAVHFLEFFQGAMMALDSLRQAGMKLDVSFYDTRRSIDRTLELLDQPGMNDLDLMIGPFYPFNLELASDFARKEKIPLVTPFYSELNHVWDNPYLFQPSFLLEDAYREMAKVVASRHDYNIVYVREEDSLDIEKHQVFQDLIYDGFDQYRPQEPVIFKEMVLTLEHNDELIQSLSADRKNLVVVPTRNEALASRVVSSLYYRLKDFHIEVLGTAYWTEFASIDYRYFHALNLMFCNPFFLNYLDADTDAFLRRYRSFFYAEPASMSRKGINYGLAGYDLTFYFVNALKIYGPRFILSLDEYHPPQVFDPFHFSRISNAGGYVNRNLTFYHFTPEMNIEEMEVPEAPEREYFFRPFEQRGSSIMIVNPEK